MRREAVGHSGGGYVRGMACTFAVRRGIRECDAADRMTAIARGMTGKRLRHVDLTG